MNTPANSPDFEIIEAIAIAIHMLYPKTPTRDIIEALETHAPTNNLHALADAATDTAREQQKTTTTDYATALTTRLEALKAAEADALRGNTDDQGQGDARGH